MDVFNLSLPRIFFLDFQKKLNAWLLAESFSQREFLIKGMLKSAPLRRIAAPSAVLSPYKYSAIQRVIWQNAHFGSMVLL